MFFSKLRSLLILKQIFFHFHKIFFTHKGYKYYKIGKFLACFFVSVLNCHGCIFYKNYRKPLNEAYNSIFL
jgi:hypothetical protein